MAYHHGDARAALLRAASDLLELKDPAALSLRRVAERAGLSRQAPYNHFADKRALLAELARAGFEQLTYAMGAIDPVQPPQARLAAAARCYLSFAMDRPALFNLMFDRNQIDIAKYSAARDAADGALAQLSAIIRTLDPAPNADDASIVAWSLVHGYATLRAALGIEHPADQDRRAGLFARTVAALGAVSPERP